MKTLYFGIRFKKYPGYEELEHCIFVTAYSGKCII
jgi:hypothetical protein